MSIGLKGNKYFYPPEEIKDPREPSLHRVRLARGRQRPYSNSGRLFFNGAGLAARSNGSFLHVAKD